MKNLVFTNYVLNSDLLQLILWYKHDNRIDCEFDDMSLDDAKKIAADAIDWVENTQLPEVDVIERFGSSPSEWYALYYMMLAMRCEREDNNDEEEYFASCSELLDKNWGRMKRIWQMNKDEIVTACKFTIKWLREKEKEIRETTYEDI